MLRACAAPQRPWPARRGRLLAGLFFLARSPLGFALFSAFEHGSLQLVS
jgi:hypothetical protein